ncbi:hypothetical protein BJY04DRAFT_216384 [Aspergillus karnatakaensis]|uniref:uncharacterized protein n=1 Tax=Aspergillus karnatakaensis TaxID=1810916 RepID=UPI003CCD2B07
MPFNDIRSSVARISEALNLETNGMAGVVWGRAGLSLTYENLLVRDIELVFPDHHIARVAHLLATLPELSLCRDPSCSELRCDRFASQSSWLDEIPQTAWLSYDFLRHERHHLIPDLHLHIDPSHGRFKVISPIRQVTLTLAVAILCALYSPDSDSFYDAVLNLWIDVLYTVGAGSESDAYLERIKLQYREVWSVSLGRQAGNPHRCFEELQNRLDAGTLAESLSRPLIRPDGI